MLTASSRIWTWVTKIISYNVNLALLAGAVEYADCISTEGVRLPSLTSVLDIALNHPTQSVEIVEYTDCISAEG